MSYARWSKESSVYVFASVEGFVECCSCSLGTEDLHSADEVVAHMQAHIDAGHTVPAYLLDPKLYPDEDFIAMCDVFMCRELIGHDGDHTPLNDELQSIRERTMR